MRSGHNKRQPPPHLFPLAVVCVIRPSISAARLVVKTGPFSCRQLPHYAAEELSLKRLLIITGLIRGPFIWLRSEVTVISSPIKKLVTWRDTHRPHRASPLCLKKKTLPSTDQCCGREGWRYHIEVVSLIVSTGARHWSLNRCASKPTFRENLWPVNCDQCLNIHMSLQQFVLASVQKIGPRSHTLSMQLIRWLSFDPNPCKLW